MTDRYDHPLAVMLDVSVPLKLMQLQERGGPNAEDWAKLREFHHVLLDMPSAAESLVVRGTYKKGLPVEMFNRLTHAIAVMSFIEGGIHFAGRHYDGSQPVVVLRGDGDQGERA